jgi:ppGpp synthetase/RelA/SpoT-type nucleotidyltranferase
MYPLPFWFLFFGRQIECALRVLKSQLELVRRNCIYDVTWRAKSKESIENKLIRKKITLKHKSQLFEKLDDLFGVRVIVYNLSDAYKIRDFLKGLPRTNARLTPSEVYPGARLERSEYIEAGSELIFEIKRTQNRLARPSPAGYRAMHLYLEREIRIDSYEDIEVSASLTRPVLCEIQVFTLAQEVWARLSHRDIYKDEVRIPREIKILMRSMSDQLHGFDGVVQVIRDRLERLRVPIRSVAHGRPAGATTGDARRKTAATRVHITTQSISRALQSHVNLDPTDRELQAVYAAARLANYRTEEQFERVITLPEVKTLSFSTTADVRPVVVNLVLAILATVIDGSIPERPFSARMNDVCVYFVYNEPWWPEYLRLVGAIF